MTYQGDIAEAKANELYHEIHEAETLSDIIDSNHECWSCGTAIPVGKKYCEMHCDHPANEFDDFTGKCGACGKSINVNMMMSMAESKASEAQLMREVQDGFEFSVIDHGSFGMHSPDVKFLEVGIFDPSGNSQTQGYMTQEDVDKLLSVFKRDPLEAFRSIGGESKANEEFKEDEHPRDSDGKFGSGGSSEPKENPDKEEPEQSSRDKEFYDETSKNTLDTLNQSKINGFPFFAYTGKPKQIISDGKGGIILYGMKRNPNSIRRVDVKYDEGRDTYTVSFMSNRNKPKGEYNDVYFDQLGGLIAGNKGLGVESYATEGHIWGDWFGDNFKEEYTMDQDGAYRCKHCDAWFDMRGEYGSHSPQIVAKYHLKTEHGIGESKSSEGFWLDDPTSSLKTPTLSDVPSFVGSMAKGYGKRLIAPFQEDKSGDWEIQVKDDNGGWKTYEYGGHYMGKDGADHDAKNLPWENRVVRKDSGFESSDEIVMYDGSDDVGGVRMWWDFELPQDDEKHKQVSDTLGVDQNKAWGFLTKEEQSKLSSYRLGGESLANEVNIEEEFDNWNLANTGNPYTLSNWVDYALKDNFTEDEAREFWKKKLDGGWSTESKASEADWDHLTAEDEGGLDRSIARLEKAFYREIEKDGDEDSFRILVELARLRGIKKTRFGSYESKASEVGTWADIERDEGQSMSLLARNVWIQDHFNELSSEDFTRLADSVYQGESKANELDLKNYTINPFDDVWVSECKQCGAEFTEFDYDNSENSVRNHLMSEHGIDDSHLGNTLYNQNEAKAKEDYLGNSGGSGHGYGEQLPESIAKHYENNRWSGHDGLVDYYATCKICGKEISAFSLDKYGIHLVEEHGITESLASETNGYIAFYEDQQTEIYADTSYDAQKKAIDFFNPPESKKHTVTVMIAEQDGEQITHTFTEAIDWYSKIEDLASKSGVKRIPVENFLSTIGANDDENIAMMNFEMDSSMYNWNGQTQKAILEGIHIYFSQVK